MERFITCVWSGVASLSLTQFRGRRVRLIIAKWIAREKDIPVAIEGVITKETEKAIFIEGSVWIEDAICCARCGRELTHPASRLVGVGPECAAKWLVYYPSRKIEDWTEEELNALKAKVGERKVSAWLPKSAIKKVEFLVHR